MKVAVIEGEDASPEVMQPSVALLDQLELGIEWTYPEVGAAAQAAVGDPFPDSARQIIDDADTTLFGSTNGANARALFYLRWGKQTYANVRPARMMAGARSPLFNPEAIDFVVVRENLEDIYMGIEGELTELSGMDLFSPYSQKPVNAMGEGRYALKLITREGTERVVRFSFELALQRAARLGRAGRVTCACKHNILPGTDGYFRAIAEEVAPDYPEVAFQTFLADDFLYRMIKAPQELDVVVMPNMYGDLFSDGAASLVGGLGLAPSGCYGEDYAYFESAHGSAPDIAGMNIINPTATLLSAAMMLDYLGLGEAARGLDAAIRRVFQEGRILTPDQGGSASTSAFCDAVLDAFRSA